MDTIEKVSSQVNVKELLRIVDREFFLISAADNVQVSIMERFI